MAQNKKSRNLFSRFGQWIFAALFGLFLIVLIFLVGVSFQEEVKTVEWVPAKTIFYGKFESAGEALVFSEQHFKLALEEFDFDQLAELNLSEIEGEMIVVPKIEAPTQISDYHYYFVLRQVEAVGGSLVEFEHAVQSSLARFWPQPEVKTLPDGSLYTELLAGLERFEFKLAEDYGLDVTFHYLKVAEFDLEWAYAVYQDKIFMGSSKVGVFNLVKAQNMRSPAGFIAPVKLSEKCKDKPFFKLTPAKYSQIFLENKIFHNWQIRGCIF